MNYNIYRKSLELLEYHMNKQNMNNTNLYKWLFHYNIYTHKWCAFTREDYLDYFNGKKEPISSSNINTLIEIIEKTDGDLSKILNLEK